MSKVFLDLKLQNMTNKPDSLTAIMTLVFIIPAVLFFLFLDYLLVTSMAMAAAYCLFYSLVFAASGFLLKERRAALVSIAILLVCVSAIQGIDYNSKKPFLKDTRKIKSGMKRSEVESIMSGYMASSGNQYNPDEQKFSNFRNIQTLTYGHTRKGRGESDVTVVTLSDDIVINVSFLPD